MKTAMGLPPDESHTEEDTMTVENTYNPPRYSAFPMSSSIF